MKRWPIIRHIRCLYLTWRVNQHYRMWAPLGYYETSDSDRQMLRAIWRGEA